MLDNELEQKSKIETLMEIVRLMKQLQGSPKDKKPMAMELEVKSHKMPGAEEESPSDEANDLSSELSLESPEQDQEEMEPEAVEGLDEESEQEMELPEAFKKLLAEKLKR